MGTLSIWYEPENDFLGLLTAQARSGKFAGQGSAWFNRSELMEFASRLAAYPLPWGAEVTLQGGYRGAAANDGLTQIHLRVAFKPHDRTGRIRVSMILSDPYEDMQADELAHSTNLYFLTTYNRVSTFRQELLALISGQGGVAQLQGGEE